MMIVPIYAKVSGYTYLKTLLSQHLEDIGDRELEKFLAETTIAK
jgi:hypothetical protein